MKLTPDINLHTALEVAILLQKSSATRTALIKLIRDAYQNSMQLNIDILNHRLEILLENAPAQVIVDVNYYMLCLRLDTKHCVNLS